MLRLLSIDEIFKISYEKSIENTINPGMKAKTTQI